ncbi:hypothetical protein PMIN06_011844 [Paraphaeosphaeria minitans]
MVVRRPGRVALLLFVAGLAWFAVVATRSSWVRARAYVGQRVPGRGFAPVELEQQLERGRVGGEDGLGDGGFEGADASFWGGRGVSTEDIGASEASVLRTWTAAALPWETVGRVGSKLDYEDVNLGDEKKYMEGMLDWNRPSWVGHWPPFEDYIGRDYDPNRWEEFELDNRFYTAGHHRLSPKTASNPTPYLPLPAYNTPSWTSSWHGTHTPCTGPRGLPLNISVHDHIHAYTNIPASFPKVFAGGYDVVGLDGSACFDRYSRYGAYGFGSRDANVLHWEAPPPPPVAWGDVDWGRLQDECVAGNAGRYAPGAQAVTVKSRSGVLPDDAAVEAAFSVSSGVAGPGARSSAQGRKYHARTAVLIRAWTGYVFEEDDVLAVRAMVSELSLASGGEYEVFVLLHVKDGEVDVFGNRTLYEEVVRENVPRELRGLAVLWSESVLREWYPEVGDWQVYWHQFMCLQWFSLTHPHFDYIWNWETDARYTGHHHHFLSTLTSFAAAQPRKLLWERNKRFYLPSVHGSYASFVKDTHAAVLNASSHALLLPPVWGPRPWPHSVPPQEPLGPAPPTSFEEDAFEWGVGEAADLITLLPLWDPRNTSWSYRHKIWNYAPSPQPTFSGDDATASPLPHAHAAFAHLDRRVSISTVARLSKTLLHAMHTENRAGRAMQAEMWPGTVALQHGLKAVYAPHPVFADRVWPAPYAAAVFDAAAHVHPSTGGAVERVQGAWTEEGDSPYNHDREAQFGGWSWYFSTKFPRCLYRRWLGWGAVREEWGEGEKVEGGKGADGERGERRMCMPAMLLHPVKGMAEEKIRV